MLTNKELCRIMDERSKYRYICPCGRRTSIRPKLDWIICTWCGNKIYTKRGKFKKKLLKIIAINKELEEIK